jgi:O-acetyl-ADP-ribose deacetylase (regulator of RNase III)
LLGMATGSIGGNIGKAAKIAYRAYNAFHKAGSTLRHAGLVEQVVGAVTGYGASKIFESTASSLVPPRRPKGNRNYWPKKV